MGTVIDKLNYLKETKTAIRNALVDKGVEVADTDTFRSYAQKVVDIPVGGGDIDALIDGTLTEITSNVTTIRNYAFYRYDKLTSVNFPLVTSIGKSAFVYCTNLISANFPLATSVGYSLFQECNSLREATFPLATSIDNSAFYNTSLREASFPLVTSIADYAFFSCILLQKVSFPLVTSIGNSVFSACTALKTMYIGTESDTVCTLSNSNAIPSSVTDIYVPEMLVDSYKAAANWSDFADKIKAYTDETA